MINKQLHSLLFALFVVTFSFFTAQGQSLAQHDSITYESQREKVNTLLKERARRFGEYDESLTQKTGVFGIFKTKGDMQKSIDILKEIVINDNKIFAETRKLLDLKDFEKDRYQRLATEYDTQVSAYMKTVTKLQQENDRLRENVQQMENMDHDNDILIYLSLLVIVILSVVVFFQYRHSIRQKVTKL